MEKLKPGTKYLSGSIGGKEGIKICLFPNEKKKDTDPDYTGSLSLALWVNTKKEGVTEEKI